MYLVNVHKKTNTDKYESCTLDFVLPPKQFIQGNHQIARVLSDHTTFLLKYS